MLSEDRGLPFDQGVSPAAAAAPAATATPGLERMWRRHSESHEAHVLDSRIHQLDTSRRCWRTISLTRQQLG